MTRYALDLWKRAGKTFNSAKALLEMDDTDSSASRSYYAAFYAVSALFALDEKSFKKHSAVESAVHKELVHSGKWTKELGNSYSTLHSLRGTADYGGQIHVSLEEAGKAIQDAEEILNAVKKEKPELDLS